MGMCSNKERGECGDTAILGIGSDRNAEAQKRPDERIDRLAPAHVSQAWALVPAANARTRSVARSAAGARLPTTIVQHVT